MCKDKLLTYLNDSGYSVVRLPRVGINPLLVVGGEKKNLEIFGPLSEIVLNGGAIPQVTADKQAANITGKKTDKFEIGFGIKFLDKLLSAFGIVGANLDAAYHQAHTVEFEMQNVKVDSVFPTTVGNYLSEAKPNITHPLIESFDEENEAYVIFETLKSNSFGVTAYDDRGTTVDIDVANINNLLGASSKVNASGDRTRKVSYQGDKFLSFGIKVFPVWVEITAGKARFRMGPPPSSPGAVTMKMMSIALLDPNEPTPVILGRDTLIKLR